MVISDQGWAAICAYESASSAAYGAKQSANRNALALMVNHLARDHGFGVRKISMVMGVKQRLVKELLKKQEGS